MYAKHRFLAESLGRGYRPDGADRLIEELETDGRELTSLLQAAERCRFSWVLLPEALALAEARDGVAALAASGIGVSEIVVNRVTPGSRQSCPLCDGRRAAERRVLSESRRAFPALPIRALPALDGEPRGLPALRAVGGLLRRGDATMSPTATQHARSRRAIRRAGSAPRAWPSILDALAPSGVRLLVVAGKGGVGKTTVAAAIALALARSEAARARAAALGGSGALARRRPRRGRR